MKINLYLKRPNAKTQSTIYAQISYAPMRVRNEHNKMRLKYYLQEQIAPHYWNVETQRVHSKKTAKGERINGKSVLYYPQHAEFNYRLNSICATIENVFRQYQNDNGAMPQPDTLKVLLDKAIKKIDKPIVHSERETFMGYFKTIIEQSQNGTRVHPKFHTPISGNTIKTYVTTYKHLCNFQKVKKREIDFNTIDYEFYVDYKTYLMQKHNLSNNTIGKHFQIIKLLMNEATEMGINTNLAYKSKKFVVLRENSDSIYLNDTEINAIENLNLTNNLDLQHTRDLFIIGCRTGLRFSDFTRLKAQCMNDGFIEISQEKTNNKVVIPIHKSVEAIFNKYNGVLPTACTNQEFNRRLKEIAQMVDLLQTSISIGYTKGGKEITANYPKFELVTTHTARRSFATNEYLQGTPTLMIMAITGHRTERSFMKYIKVTKRDEAERLKQLWLVRENSHLKVV
jgi:integrase